MQSISEPDLIPCFYALLGFDCSLCCSSVRGTAEEQSRKFKSMRGQEQLWCGSAQKGSASGGAKTRSEAEAAADSKEFDMKYCQLPIRYRPFLLLLLFFSSFPFESQLLLTRLDFRLQSWPPPPFIISSFHHCQSHNHIDTLGRFIDVLDLKMCSPNQKLQ